MMTPENKRKIFRLAAVAVPLVAADQLTKWWIQKALSLYDDIPVIPGFFSLTHAHNPGGAFGVFAGHSMAVRVALFLVLTLVASGMVLYMYFKTPLKSWFFGGALALIFSGAIGNLIDRFRFGYVDDFLLFYIGRHQWPAFNVADSCVTVGVTVLVIHVLFHKEPL